MDYTARNYMTNIFVTLKKKFDTLLIVVELFHFFAITIEKCLL